MLVSLSVCALSASIIWERIASRRETGLLIPSVYNCNRLWMAIEHFICTLVVIVSGRLRFARRFQAISRFQDMPLPLRTAHIVLQCCVIDALSAVAGSACPLIGRVALRRRRCEWREGRSSDEANDSEGHEGFPDSGLRSDGHSRQGHKERGARVFRTQNVKLAPTSGE